MSETILVTKSLSDDGILRITMNDERRRNALSEEMLNQLHEILHYAGNTQDVRVVILSAIGPAFSAGHDLKQMTAARNDSDGGKAYFTKILSLCASVMQGIITCPKPIIAEVDGVATAAGCQLVASCDLAIASYISKFSTPGVHIGLFCSTPMVALSRNVTNKHAMEMLLTGDMLSADRAAEIGLVNHAVSPDALQQATHEMAMKIASKSQMTLATGKTAFYVQSEMSLSSAYDFASQVMVENMMAHDAKEGIQAFIEKRKPEWQDS